MGTTRRDGLRDEVGGGEVACRAVRLRGRVRGYVTVEAQQGWTPGHATLDRYTVELIEAGDACGSGGCETWNEVRALVASLTRDARAV